MIYTGYWQGRMAILITKTLVCKDEEKSEFTMEKKLGRDFFNHTILRRDEGTYKHSFYAFLSNEHACNYIRSLPVKERLFHEVIFGQYPQRVKLDLDIKYTDFIAVGEIEQVAGYQGLLHDRYAKYIADELLIAFMIVCHPHEFTTPPTFERNIIITESHALPPEFPESKCKLSYHIILRGYTLPSCDDVKKVVTKLKSRLHPAVADWIDNTTGKVQSLRLLGCHKAGSERIKMLSRRAFTFDPTNMADTFVQHCPNDEFIVLHDSTRVLPYHVDENEALSRDIVCAIRQIVNSRVKHIDAFRFRACTLNALFYNRVIPSYCSLCERIHYNENSLIVIYNNANGEVRELCRRAPGKSILLDIIEQPKGNVKMAFLRDTVRRCQENPPQDPLLNYLYDRQEIKKIEKINVSSEPSLAPLYFSPVLYVRAPMKIGKTKALVKYISTIDPSWSVCIVSFRIAFTDNMLSNFKNFITYKDISGTISPSENKNVIIQVESLHRLREAYDLLILDESESILSQFNSGNGQKEAIGFANFVYQMKNAKQIIAMDAELNERTIEIVRTLRSSCEGESLEINNVQNCSDYTYKLTTEECQYYECMIEDVKNKKNIAVVSNSLSHINKTDQFLKDKFGEDIAIVKYTSQTDAFIKKEHMSNINEYCQAYQVLMYSPTITAGVSIEVAHFNKVYAHFTNMSCDIISSIQMLGRVRNVIDREIIMCIDTQPTCPPDTIETIHAHVERGHMDIMGSSGIIFEKIGPYEYSVVKNNRYIMWLYNELANNRSKKRYIQMMIHYIMKIGAKIVVFDDPVGGSDLPGEVEDARLKYEYAYDANVANADDLEQDEFYALVEESENKIITVEEKLSIEKYKIKQFYNMSSIYPGFYVAYSPLKVKINYVNLKAILAHPDISTSLELLQKNERTMVANNEMWYAEVYNDKSYCKHRAIWGVLRCLNVNHIVDPADIDTDIVMASLREHGKEWCKLASAFKAKLPARLDHKEEETTQKYVKLLNRFLKTFYGYSFKKIKKENSFTLCAKHEFQLIWNSDRQYEVNTGYVPVIHCIASESDYMCP